MMLRITAPLAGLEMRLREGIGRANTLRQRPGKPVPLSTHRPIDADFRNEGWFEDNYHWLGRTFRIYEGRTRVPRGEPHGDLSTAPICC
jgi:hypothetical protein